MLCTKLLIPQTMIVHTSIIRYVEIIFCHLLTVHKCNRKHDLNSKNGYRWELVDKQLSFKREVF